MVVGADSSKLAIDFERGSKTASISYIPLSKPTTTNAPTMEIVPITNKATIDENGA